MGSDNPQYNGWYNAQTNHESTIIDQLVHYPLSYPIFMMINHLISLSHSYIKYELIWLWVKPLGTQKIRPTRWDPVSPLSNQL